jgi:predicted glycosyltransferase
LQRTKRRRSRKSGANGGLREAIRSECREHSQGSRQCKAPFPARFCARYFRDGTLGERRLAFDCAAARGGGSRGILIYVQHLLGIGHLMRARLLAEALAARGFDVHLVSGGMPIGGRMPRGVRVVQLPPIRVSDASFTPLRDADFQPIDDAYRERRRAQLLAAYDAAAPAAVLFETFPFGRRSLRFELFPLLERIDATRPRPLVIASIREILQVQPKPEREREMLAWAARWFDAIFVHGDARFARFEDTFALADELTPPVHYTGFVAGTGEDEAEAAAPPPAREEVVVSAGGGGVGIELLATALAAQPRSRLRDRTWRVLAGPNIPEAGIARLRAIAGARAIVERSRVDFARLLRGAFVSISQAGYNTTLDVVTSGVRPVVVPFTGNGETEQRARGERLRRFDLAVVVDDRTLTAETRARAVDEAATRPAFARWDFASDGAARTAALVGELVADAIHR